VPIGGNWENTVFSAGNVKAVLDDFGLKKWKIFQKSPNKIFLLNFSKIKKAHQVLSSNSSCYMEVEVWLIG
jgi:hypothetical protein